MRRGAQSRTSSQPVFAGCPRGGGRPAMRLLHSLASPPDLWTTALGPGVSWGTLLFPGCPILPSQRLQGSPCPPRPAKPASLTGLSLPGPAPGGAPKAQSCRVPPDRRPSISSLAPGSVPTLSGHWGSPPADFLLSTIYSMRAVPTRLLPVPKGPVSCPSSLCPPLAETRYHRPVSRAGSPHQSLECHPGRATPTRSLARGVSCSRPTPKNHNN